MLAGAFAGLAGAQLSLGVVTLFNKTMTGGRGFIALAAFYFGDARPGLTALGAVIFGVFEAAGFRLGSSGIPSQLVQMLPYLDQANIYAEFDFSAGAYDKKNARAAGQTIGVFHCALGGGYPSYAACHHDVEAPIGRAGPRSRGRGARCRPRLSCSGRNPPCGAGCARLSSPTD